MSLYVLSAHNMCTVHECVTDSPPALLAHKLLDPALPLTHLLLVLPVRIMYIHRNAAAVNMRVHMDRARLQGTYIQFVA